MKSGNYSTDKGRVNKIVTVLQVILSLPQSCLQGTLCTGVFCVFRLSLLFLIDPPKDNGGAPINKYVVEMAEGSNGKHHW